MLEASFCSGQISRTSKSRAHESLWFRRYAVDKSLGKRSFQSSHGRLSDRRWLLVWELYLVVIIFFAGAPCTVVAQDAVAQGRTLRSLAKSWRASFSDWERSEDPCQGNWTGVTCDQATNSKVLSLRLNSTNLIGSIPKEIGQLVFLEQLDLSNNSIQGAIPEEIGQLTHLQVLKLNKNNLTSPPPRALLSCNLRELSLNVNKMTGKLPSWIGQIEQLVRLDMQDNVFWGGLPPEYGNLKNLRILELWQNKLSGNIPDEWRGMSSIQDFKLGHNYLTGSLPEWFFSFSTLRIMNIPRNQLIGQFPNLTRHLRNGISNITVLDIECNYFKGEYPQQYFDTLAPGVNISIKYNGSCFDNETDTSQTINRRPNATQNTPTLCARALDCDSFYEEVASNQGCAPCPSGQELIDESKCICGIAQPSKIKSLVGVILGGVVGGVLVIIGALLLMLICHKKSNRLKYPDFGRTQGGSDEPWIVPEELRRFRLQELEKATDGFDEKCFAGSGGFGKVYRGVLSDGTIVAIKCAVLHSAQGQTEFRNELNLLSRLHHRNLVRLEGFCDDDGLQILVYEYMENRDLHANLFGKDGKQPLDSFQRLEVVLGIARGLDYLHSFADPPVIHRDIKLSNVLLNQSMTAKLADFGVSRISADTHVSTAPMGTIGYLDPEYFTTNQLTTASDVYAFGIVVLEIITGLRVIDSTRLDATSFNAWVQQRFNEGGIRSIIDRNLEIGYSEDLFTDLTHLALRCSERDRLLRPSMKDALLILEPYARTLKKEPSRQRIEWSTSHFENKSLIEQETPNIFDSNSSHMYAIEIELLNPGQIRSNVNIAYHNSGLPETFTDPQPR